jgi:riboflavin kinase/FMN adenylyltransferase
MKILESLEEFKDPREPLVLTIGNFDGMHRGHCALIKKVKDLSGNEGQTVVITFRNHPSEILRPEQPVCLLCTLPHKLHLLAQCTIDCTIILKFTTYLAQHNAASFIETIRQSIPFTHLVLGYDATLGRDKQGDRATMLELGDLWGFTTYYLDEYRFEGQPVSSSKIRAAVRTGNLLEAETLLDRPYSIYAPVITKEIELSNSGSAMIDVTRLCLPPDGSYAIESKIDGKLKEGIAIIKDSLNTERKERVILEIQLEDKSQPINASYIEILFKHAH